MAEIAAASDEQSAGIEQVNHAITQMDDVTQQNAALVEQAAAAAEAMREQANALTVAVSVFKLESGKGGTPATVTNPVKSLSKAGIPRQALASSSTSRKGRRMIETKVEMDGDWKEF